MDWQNDPELEKLFKDELDERSLSLAEGANAMLEGEINSELTGRMIREGHTIKGTGRVMGYEAIARGGEVCEGVWRFIQLGELTPSPMLARTLLLLAESIPEALAGDEALVSDAIDTVRTMIHDPGLLEKIPLPLTVPEPSVSSEPASLPEQSLSDVDVVSQESSQESEGESESDVDVVSQESFQESESRLDREPERLPEDLNDEPGLAIQETAVQATQAASAPELPELSPPSTLGSDVEPLVFEPGPDGKLATPKITYEIMAETPTAEVPASAEPHPIGTAMAPADSNDFEAPPSLTLVGTGRSVLDPDTNESYDLGGLVGLVETWATEESVPVNAGRLFRMINDVAALRIDIASAVRPLAQMLSGDQTGAAGTAPEGVLESIDAVRRSSIRLESAALSLTVTPISNITSTLPQLVKYLSKNVSRDIDLIVEGEDTLIDRQLIDRVGEIIRHLVINSVMHGVESAEDRVAAGKNSQGAIRVSVSRDEDHLQIAVSDDGSGIDWIAVRERAIEAELLDEDPTAEELRAVLFSDGFSTLLDSADFTGSGAGLDRVTAIVEEVFGSMTFDSAQGRGTSVVITMPAHRALQRAQMFMAGGRTWGIPASTVSEVLSIPDVSISVTDRGSSIGVGGESVPYASFASVAGLEIEGIPAQLMIIQSPSGSIALAVDEVLDVHEVATKDLGPLLSGRSVVSGVALLGGSDTVMLVDAGRLADNMRSLELQPVGPIRRVLVVDDSQGVRQVVSGVLASHGFSTVAAGSVSAALAALSGGGVDALVVDFSMPRADGVALIHMVRQRYGTIPIVMLSGVASDEDRERAERAGVDAFFDKADFARGALVEKLRELIENEIDADVDSESGESVIAS